MTFTLKGGRGNAFQFLEPIRTHINDFVDKEYAVFSPFNWSDINDNALWNSDNPLGAIVNIDIKGPDNGSVIVSGYSSDKWTFTTIYEPIYGEHPVSGNRDFGFTYNPDGGYTFYTRGVDRLTSIEGTALHEITEKFGKSFPFAQADGLWSSFQSKISQFVKANQGSSTISQQEIHRPKWQKLKDVLDGKAPLNSLSKDCN